MISHEGTVDPAMAVSSPIHPPTPTPASPYLSLRQAVRPAIFAHFLLAEDSERARHLAAECEDLLFLTRELLKAAGLASILGTQPAGVGLEPEPSPEEDGGDRREQLLGAYAEAGLLWAKVVGSTMALARSLLDRGEWDEVRLLASYLAAAGEQATAAELKVQLGKAVWATRREPLEAVSSTMPPAAIAQAIAALRDVLREIPDDVPDRNREVNRFLAPLAASVLAIMRNQETDIPYTSRVEHIATGGVARYPDIVMLSLDEIAAEFEGMEKRACPGLSTILTR
jgi:hypothetical protein